MAVKEVNGTEFEDMIASGKTVVDFFATWCVPCQMMAPVIDKVSDEYRDVKFIKVDIDKELSLALKHKVVSVPTLMVFEDGKAVNKSIGVISEEELKDLLKL